MAFSSQLMHRTITGDGLVTESYRLWFNGVTTGTVQLPLVQDLRKVTFRATDLSTAGTALGGSINMNTGVITLTGAVADNVLTAESGGSAGTFTFTATGGVIGQAIAGTGIAAGAIMVNYSGTTATSDLPLTAAVGTDIVGNTAGILTVTYYS